MSNAKHTPGPWTAHNGHTVSFVNSTAPGVSKDGGEATITMLMGGQHGATVEELQANAKLIAAAPDMLEALQHIQGHWDAAMGEGNEAYALDIASCKTCKQLAHNAIAKATE